MLGCRRLADLVIKLPAKTVLASKVRIGTTLPEARVGSGRIEGRFSSTCRWGPRLYVLTETPSRGGLSPDANATSSAKPVAKRSAQGAPAERRSAEP